ncbi:bactofilin family protein [Paenibacillus sanguinis]|uniref:bactofilin family protein n=1 Tax=Paenibacillus sanguinis TaxID=225906 RepID=UPI000368E06A|nr:polymer-forming cytoskeletal protein [Paenibacillus sanguinis]
MFKETKKSTTDTLIGQGSLFEGKLECKSNLRVEGQVHGEINCLGQVVIGKTGEVQSSIKGADVVVAGTVFGDISTSGRLTIADSGRVVGDVHVAKLVIIEGGALNGMSRMEKPAPAVTQTAGKEKGKNQPQAEAG